MTLTEALPHLLKGEGIYPDFWENTGLIGIWFIGGQFKLLHSNGTVTNHAGLLLLGKYLTANYELVTLMMENDCQ